MKQPYHKLCPVCNEDIYGFSVKDFKWRMIMHTLKHRQKEKEKEETTQ